MLKMMKIIALLIVLSILIVLTACGENNTNTLIGQGEETSVITIENTNNANDRIEDSPQGMFESTTNGNNTDTIDSTDVVVLPEITSPTTAVPNKTNDTTAPVITDISINQQGQTLKSGDTLTINVSITEESDISTCQIGFENTTTGARINTHASFKHRSDGKYTYTYTITDDMNAGKWVLERTFIGDKYSLYGDDTITDMSAIYFFVE